MQARYYDPILGRFYGNDPVGFQAGTGHSFNRYAYVANNPYAYNDPNGEWLNFAIGGALGALEDIAFQGIMMALGAQDEFSYSSVAMSTGLAVATSGVSAYAQGGRLAMAAGKLGKKILGKGDDVAKGVGKFDVHPRVANQLNDPRMGRLQGKLTNDDLQQLANNPNATRILDNRSGNINVIQEVEGKTLRITVPRDDMKIISVGPIRPNQVKNLLEKGDFTPLK